MMRLQLRPTPLGFALGLVVVAFWALLWLAFLAQVLQTPEALARQSRAVPELARVGANGGYSNSAPAPAGAGAQGKAAATA